MRAPTGDQYELERDSPAGHLSAVITQVAAGIRRFTVGGVDVTEPFDADATPPSACGIILAPWPNRVKDARWSAKAPGGDELRLAVTEPERGNAIHGLLRFTEYRLAEHTADAVTLTASVHPQLGYPYQLATTVRHELTETGMLVTQTATNVGADRAPVALGAHPYLKIGDVPTADLVLTVHANTQFTVDDRMNVTGSTPVEATPFDLRGGVRVGDLELDHGFGDVEFCDGRVEHSVTAPDGRSVVLWGDENVKYVQAFTHRSFATLPAGSVAVAIEPMTAPANALNTWEGLTWLEPGESWQMNWGIEPRGFGAAR